MQISGVSNSTPISAARTAPSSSAVAPSSDQAVLNTSADSFSSLVQEAAQMPDVRSEVVDAYRSRIQAGNYPSEDTLAGLTRVIGGGVMQLAQTDSASY